MFGYWFKIVSTICDQGSNNRSAINSLVKNRKENYLRMGIQKNEYVFEINDEEIVPLYDVPHLFKGIRNNLLKYNLHFEESNHRKEARWSDIFTAFRMDGFFGDLRMLPKITDQHVNPQKIKKMKVSTCTQVFSHTYAVAINVFSKSGMAVETEGNIVKMDARASDTASLLEFLDTLFDSLNGSSFTPKNGKKNRVAVTQGSPHMELWNESIRVLKSFRFVRNGKDFVPPSVTNLIKTIQNFKVLYVKFRAMSINYLMPRTFNQDPIENFFGKVRQRGYRFIHPTAASFTPIYKSLLVNGLTSGHSVGANCEDDNSEICLTLQRLVSQGLPEEEENEPVQFSKLPKEINILTKPLEIKILKYVSGYILKKTKKSENCTCLEELFLKRNIPEDADDDEFTTLKEYGDIPRLHYVNKDFLLKMNQALQMIKFYLQRDLHKQGVLNHINKVLIDTIELTKCWHNKKHCENIFKYLIRVTSFNYVKQVNQVMKGLNLKKLSPNTPKHFVEAQYIFKRKIRNKYK